MIFDLTPARPIPPEILRDELTLAREQAHREHLQTGRISNSTIDRVREIVAITEAQLAIQEAQLS